MLFRYVWLLLLLLYCALIYYLSNQSTLPVPMVFNMQDKWIHAAAYAVMAFLFWQVGKMWMLRAGLKHWNILAVIAVLFCSLYGMTDEWHQSFVAGRDASVFDWLADTVGALLMIIILRKREFASV